jgi:hypothetical protein
VAIIPWCFVPFAFLFNACGGINWIGTCFCLAMFMTCWYLVLLHTEERKIFPKVCPDLSAANIAFEPNNMDVFTNLENTLVH